MANIEDIVTIKLNKSDLYTNISESGLLYPQISATRAVLIGIPSLAIIICTIAGNTLVLLLQAKVAKRETTLLIWNLGVADFLVGVIVLPLGAVYLILERWPFGRIACKIWASCDVIFCTASIITLCIISLDRYIGVTRPLQYKVIVTKRRVKLAIVGIWSVSIGILIGTLRYDVSNSVPHDASVCLASYELQFVIHSVIGAFFVPCIITLVLYWRIYKVAKRREQNLRAGLLMALGSSFIQCAEREQLRMHRGSAAPTALQNQQQRQRQRSVINMHKTAAKTLGMVVGCFVLCWLPFFCLYLANHHCSCIPLLVIDSASWMGYCNSMINPVIYTFTVTNFRKSLTSFSVAVWQRIWFFITCKNLITRKRRRCRHSVAYADRRVSASISLTTNVRKASTRVSNITETTVVTQHKNISEHGDRRTELKGKALHTVTTCRNMNPTVVDKIEYWKNASFPIQRPHHTASINKQLSLQEEPLTATASTSLFTENNYSTTITRIGAEDHYVDEVDAVHGQRLHKLSSRILPQLGSSSSVQSAGVSYKGDNFSPRCQKICCWWRQSFDSDYSLSEMASCNSV